MKKEKRKGFTVVELLVTIAIISVVSVIAFITVNSIINNSKEKSVDLVYESLKKTGVSISMELSDEYWSLSYDESEQNILVSCISVQDMINLGYYKEKDFINRDDDINKDTYVIVKKNRDNLAIVSEEIDTTGYCKGSFNNARLEVTKYSPNTISVTASCGSGYEYYYSYKMESATDYNKPYILGNKNFTYTGLTEGTIYNLNVECRKSDSITKIGTATQKTGGKIKIDANPEECYYQGKTITITYKDGDNHFFEIGSSGSIESKYEVVMCKNYNISSCSEEKVVELEKGKLYKIGKFDEDGKVKIIQNNNGYITASSVGEKYFSKTTYTISTIDKTKPNPPTIVSSDGIASGQWHNANYTLILSGGENSEDTTICNTITYEYSKDSTDEEDFKKLNSETFSINSEEKNTTYYFRSVNAAGNYSDSISYVSNLDKTKPVCSFSNVSDVLKDSTTTAILTCTDTGSGLDSQTLSSSNFTATNVSIASISSPTAITNGYQYTITVKGTTIGTNSSITLNEGSIKDIVSNSNNSVKSNTFTVESNTFTINYNANGGSGAPSSQTKTYGVTLTLSSTIPTKTGYTFLGWSTSSSATSATYSAGGSYTANASATLYAVWSIKTYTISYNANGGSGAPSSQTKTYGVTLKLSSTTPTKTGYTFLGWSTSSSATSATYSAGGSYTSNASATLYAVWSAKTYTISYDANGGSGAPSSQTKTYGVTLTLSSTIPTKTGYTFLGWSTSSSATSATYSAGGSYTANASVTLYAVWKANEVYDQINGYHCSGSNIYYITQCGQNSGICEYTEKNDSSSSGTIALSSLSGISSTCANYQIGSSNYSKTINKAISLASSGNIIKLLNSVTDNTTANFSKNITFNTNGKTLTRNSTITINSGYTLTTTGTGGISSTGVNTFSVNGTLKITGGNYSTSSGNETSVVRIYSTGSLQLTDSSFISLNANNGGYCGYGIYSESSSTLNINATYKGIGIYGSCNGITAKQSSVNVTSSYSTSSTGVYNWIMGKLGYAIYAKGNIVFGSANTAQSGGTAYYPWATSQSYTTNTSVFNVLNANGTITMKSGSLYTTFAAGTYQSDGDKPTYTGTGDTYKGKTIGGFFSNKKISTSSGYGLHYFTASDGNVALRVCYGTCTYKD